MQLIISHIFQIFNGNEEIVNADLSDEVFIFGRYFFPVVALMEIQRIIYSIVSLKYQLRRQHALIKGVEVDRLACDRGKLTRLKYYFLDCIGKILARNTVKYHVSDAYLPFYRLVAGFIGDYPAQPVEILFIIIFAAA